MHDYEPHTPADRPPAPGVIVAELVPDPPIRVVPTPGVGETFLWLLGWFGSQIVVGLLAAAVMIAAGGRIDVEELDTGPLLFLGTLSTVIYAVIVARVRGGRHWGASHGVTVPSPIHLAFVVLAFLPLITIDSYVLNWLIREAMELVPSLDKGDFDIALLEPLREMPLGLAILAGALFPAVGEELLFRGFIGRGLVGRLGVAKGVLLTSVLFAVAHIFPLQVVAVFPLGVVLHLAYLSSRSLWVPIALHFANNLTAILAVRGGELRAFGHDLDLVGVIDQPPAELMVLAGLSVVFLLVLLWQSRAAYSASDGRLWDPGYPTGEAPPGSVAARRVRRRVHPLTALAVVAAIAGFVAALVHYASTSDSGAPKDQRAAACASPLASLDRCRPPLTS